jgi:hypothetical protein
VLVLVLVLVPLVVLVLVLLMLVVSPVTDGAALVVVVVLVLVLASPVTDGARASTQKVRPLPANPCCSSANTSAVSLSRSRSVRDVSVYVTHGGSAISELTRVYCRQGTDFGVTAVVVIGVVTVVVVLRW